MKILIALYCLFFFPGLLHAQESELIVRYDFSEKSSPPMNIFYLRVYVDGVLMDSTKPHRQNHNLANAAQMKITQGNHEIKIEGIVLEENTDAAVLKIVMEWKQTVKAGKSKTRVKLKLNGKYRVESATYNSL
jgi:hypothetical protein